MQNYIEVERALREAVRRYKKIQRPAFVKGRNMITNQLIGYWFVNGFTVELSYGRALIGDRYVYGLTVWHDDGSPSPDIEGLSRCCQSIREVEEQIELIHSCGGSYYEI